MGRLQGNANSRKKVLEIHGRLTKALSILLDTNVTLVAVAGDKYFRKLLNDYAHAKLRVRNKTLDLRAMKGIDTLLKQDMRQVENGIRRAPSQPLEGSLYNLSANDIKHALKSVFEAHEISVRNPESTSYRKMSAEVMEKITNFAENEKDKISSKQSSILECVLRSKDLDLEDDFVDPSPFITTGPKEGATDKGKAKAK